MEYSNLDVFIIRHGQTSKNLEGKIQGSGVDALLNPEGESQAARLAEKLTSFNLTGLYCSPLLRAVQTAIAIASRNNNMPITILQDLRECSFGDCEDRSIDECCAQLGKEFFYNFLYPVKDSWDSRLPNGESKHEVFVRVEQCLKHIVESLPKDQNHRIGIVCHAAVLSALQCGFNLKDVSYENCSVLHLRYDTDTREWIQVFD